MPTLRKQMVPGKKYLEGEKYFNKQKYFLVILKYFIHTDDPLGETWLYE